MMQQDYKKTAFHFSHIVSFFFSCILAFSLPQQRQAQADDEVGSQWQRLKQIRETQRRNKEAVVSEESLGALMEHIHDDAFGGREMLVYVPGSLPDPRQRKLLVALHGGGGNAQFMLDHLKSTVSSSPISMARRLPDWAEKR